MTKGKDLANQLLQNIVNMQPSRVKLGYGSFITLDFGKDVEVEVKTRRGVSKYTTGEWHLWVYMTAWRIDKNGEPFIGAEDDRELIAKRLVELEDKKLLLFSVLNNAFDSILEFEGGFKLSLFSFGVEDHEQWMLYTPEAKTFTAGPGTSWSYELSSSR